MFLEAQTLDNVAPLLVQLAGITASRLQEQFLARLVRTGLQQGINHKQQHTSFAGCHLLAISCKIHSESKGPVR